MFPTTLKTAHGSFTPPLWLLAVVLNVWLMGFALASLCAFRRWVLPRLRLKPMPRSSSAPR